MCDLDELVAKRLIEPAAPEAPARVAAELEMAKRHLESVVILRDVDPELAFAGAYDAARKAIAAHMRAGIPHNWRAREAFQDDGIRSRRARGPGPRGCS